jgi:hypothetical protein
VSREKELNIIARIGRYTRFPNNKPKPCVHRIGFRPNGFTAKKWRTCSTIFTRKRNQPIGVYDGKIKIIIKRVRLYPRSRE